MESGADRRAGHEIETNQEADVWSGQLRFVEKTSVESCLRMDTSPTPTVWSYPNHRNCGRARNIPSEEYPLGETSHNAYVGCVADEVVELRLLGNLSDSEAKDTVERAAASKVNKTPPAPPL